LWLLILALVSKLLIMIENEENLTEVEIKALESLDRRFKKIAKEIKELGFNVAIHDGTLSILKGEPFNGNKANRQNIKCNVIVGCWSGVDW
jgi:hypothetical protein